MNTGFVRPEKKGGKYRSKIILLSGITATLASLLILLFVCAAFGVFRQKAKVDEEKIPQTNITDEVADVLKLPSALVAPPEGDPEIRLSIKRVTVKGNTLNYEISALKTTYLQDGPASSIVSVDMILFDGQTNVGTYQIMLSDIPLEIKTGQSQAFTGSVDITGKDFSTVVFAYKWHQGYGPLRGAYSSKAM